MNPFSSCCSSCSDENENSFLPMGNFVPATPGYEQTYSMPAFKPMGMAGPLMGQNVARPYPGAPGPVFAEQGNPNFPQSNGNANPFYNLSKVMPAVNPMGAYPSSSNPMGITPVGESMPAQIGHPARMGNGIGGVIESMGAPQSPFRPTQRPLPAQRPLPPQRPLPIQPDFPQRRIGPPPPSSGGRFLRGFMGGQVESLGFMV